MRPLVLFLLMLASAVVTNAEHPEFKAIGESGNAFLDYCKHVEDEPLLPEFRANAVVCVGWVEGFVDGAQITDIYHQTFNHVSSKSRMTCPPEKVTFIQDVRIIRRYID